MRNYKEMIYDDVNGRWVVDLNGYLYGLHCGETFQLVTGRIVIPCRLELDSSWQIVTQDVRLNLHQQEIYKVVI